MDFEGVTPLPELERPGYHKLSVGDLERIGDAESLFELGMRYLEAMGVRNDPHKGKDLIKNAALKGHPVALAWLMAPICRASENFYAESVSRGHPRGACHIGATNSQLYTRA